MTKNQLQYWANQEIARANRAKEEETNRSNLAKETETHRANLMQEALKFIETGQKGLSLGPQVLSALGSII